jgi:hypothetical protein
MEVSEQVSQSSALLEQVVEEVEACQMTLELTLPLSLFVSSSQSIASLLIPCHAQNARTNDFDFSSRFPKLRSVSCDLPAV